MSVPSKELRARVKKVEATLATLHADIDDIVKDRVYAAAAEISGIPVGVLKQLSWIARPTAIADARHLARLQRARTALNDTHERDLSPGCAGFFNW
jgi:hypothetical protein